MRRCRHFSVEVRCPLMRARYLGYSLADLTGELDQITLQWAGGGDCWIQPIGGPTHEASPSPRCWPKPITPFLLNVNRTEEKKRRWERERDAPTWFTLSPIIFSPFGGKVGGLVHIMGEGEFKKKRERGSEVGVAEGRL